MVSKSRKKREKAAAAAAAAANTSATNDAPVNGDDDPLSSEATASGDGIPAANGDKLPPANGDGDAPPPPSPKVASGDESPADSGAVVNADGIPPPPAAAAYVEPANGDGDAPQRALLEAANGDELPLDSASAASEDGVLPPPPFSVEAPNGDKASVDSAARANRGVVEEADNGGEPMAERSLDLEAPEESRGSSSEPEREAENLKALNGLLVKEAVETRGQAAALSAQLDERFADADASAGVERAVLQAALVVPLHAAAEHGTALRGRLADAQESLQAAKARAAREADARTEAAARLGAAEAENLGFVEVLGGKDAEAAAASKNVAGMEAVVSDLAGNSTELCAEKGELEKQLGEASASVRSVQAKKAELEVSFRDYRMSTERYKQEIEVKLDEKSKQLEVLKSSKAEMEAKFQCLEAELSAAMARNRELELKTDTSKTELAAAKRKLENLQFQFATVGKKYTTLLAEADSLRNEIQKMMTIKDAAVAAHATEKTKFDKELDSLKRKIDLIQSNKDAAMASARHKDAEAAKLRAQLNELNDSIAEQRVLCDDLRAKSSSLQRELDTVQKALDDEKAEGGKLRFRLGELESYSAQKEREVVMLKDEVRNKRGQMLTLNGEVKKLQLAVADAEQMGKSGKVWTWLCPTTTVIAAASFAYAARSR